MIYRKNYVSLLLLLLLLFLLLLFYVFFFLVNYFHIDSSYITEVVTL